MQSIFGFQLGSDRLGLAVLGWLTFKFVKDAVDFSWTGIELFFFISEHSNELHNLSRSQSKDKAC